MKSVEEKTVISYPEKSLTRHDRFTHKLHAAYRAWAEVVVQHSWKIIIACLAVTAVCTFKMVTTPHQNNIKGYAPFGSRSLYEFAVREEFFAQTGAGVRMFVLMVPKNGTNMLTQENLAEAIRVDELIKWNSSFLHNHITGQQEPFAMFCRRFCKINEPVHAFYKGIQFENELLAENQSLGDQLDLSYPTMTLFGRRVNIQANFFGIHKANKTHPPIFPGHSNLHAADMVVLLYRAERIGGWSDKEIKDYEMATSRYIKDQFHSDILDVMTISTSYVEAEVDRAGRTLMPYVGLGFIVMSTCAVTSVIVSCLYFGSLISYKIPLAIVGCICPFMASGTALGVLFYCGLRYGAILAVSPFLLLAIGVDDAYLMIHAWQHVSTNFRTRPSKDDTIAERIALILIETGPSILISALANIFADAVGSFTGSMEITLLCVGNIASICVDFFYQITFFTAVLAILGQMEMNKEKKAREVEETSKAVESDSESSGSDRPLRNKVRSSFLSLVDGYITFITHWLASLFVCIIWAIFLVFAVKAMLGFEINLTTSKLFARDSPLHKIEKYRENMVLPYFTQAQIFVNNPGNLSLPEQRKKVHRLVEAMEALPYAYDKESSNYFLRDFEVFVTQSGMFGMEEEVDEDFEREMKKNVSNEILDMNELESFLSWSEYDYYRGFLNTHKDEANNTVIDNFLVYVAYHGDDLKDWYKRAGVLRQWRETIDKYGKEINATVLHDDGLYLDLLENMPTDIWQSGLATVLCMAGICLLFMWKLKPVLVAAACIASIMVCTLGWMAMQGMTMDPIVMAAVIISIGFSVDIPAHVSYHFHMAEKQLEGRVEVADRLRFALTTVGYPAFQASLSTNICVLCLLLVPLYMARVFVNVMCVCITLCAIHSLILMPALYALTANIKNFLCKS
ncbi:unnamed protein product [Bursaphelenchus xylophilus]|uniref:(pine wood nematode) hypothetical protein n=1 Tax=Bursaphelenchus xylophilus TaxID=6326 RepID=A0A1I7S1L3_BURXY|nr:unnamed protein product [Bursaphelenchus xylophilus]CAG9081307.1 unnamed protein product [Bursaphelenchus xylophilus]